MIFFPNRYFLIAVLFFILAHLSGMSQQHDILPTKALKLIVKYEKQISNYKSQGNKNQVAHYLNKIAYIYWENIKHEKALEYFKKSLKINNELNNYNAIHTISNYIGMIYNDQNEFEKSLSIFTKNLELSRKFDQKSKITLDLSNIAQSLSKLKRYQDANKNLLEAVNIAHELNNTIQLRNCYKLLAENYDKLGNANKSIEFYNFFVSFDRIIKEKEINGIKDESKHIIENAETDKTVQNTKIKTQHDSLELSEKHNRQQKMLIEMLNKEQELKNIDLKQQKSQLKFEQTIRYSLIVGIIIILFISILVYRLFNLKKRAVELLHKQNQEMFEQKVALEAQAIQMHIQNKELEKLSIVASNTDNSVLILDNNRNYEWSNDAFERLWGYKQEDFQLHDNIRNVDASHNIDDENAFNLCIKQKKSVIYTTKTKNKFRQKIWIHSTITPVYNTDNKLSKFIILDSNITRIKEVEEDITDSLCYASNIQHAILPQPDLLHKLLDKHFILYKPKHIVSGDFYWLTQKGDNHIIVAADCTGHGVPGALMSMLGIAFLKEIVNKAGTGNNIQLHANEILNQLRTYVIKSLHQNSERGLSKDGMDIAICIINYKTQILQFSGAYNPLYMIRKTIKGELLTKSIKTTITKGTTTHNIENNDYTILQIKGDRMPISIHKDADRSFTNHEIKLKSDDRIYIFSDGYTDQFGGADYKKFSFKRFRKLLLSIQNESMVDQKQIINNTIEQWRQYSARDGVRSEQIDDILLIGMKILFKEAPDNKIPIFDWSDKVILIAEDILENFLLIQGILYATNAKLIHAKNGQEAIELCAKNNDINLVLMDIKMPIMDGYEATQHIKKIRKDLPIIAQTAFAIEKEDEKAMNTGCDDYISKPIIYEDLLLKLNEYLA